MNTQSIEHRAYPPMPSPTLPQSTERNDAIGQFGVVVHALTQAMLTNVRNAAELNLSAARALLVHARIPMPQRIAEQSENWRWTWRSFEVCATAAEQVLNLTHDHVDRSATALAQAAEHLRNQHSSSGLANESLTWFDVLRKSQAAHWGAAQQARSELVTLAQTPAATTSLVRPIALLARTLAEALLATVQNTTSLNLSAARALASQAHMAAPPSIDPLNERWRWSWRSFEVCATSADQVLNLTRGHVERTTAALWRSADRLLNELSTVPQAEPMRASFEQLRTTHAAYWSAAQQAHGQIVATLAASSAAWLTSERDAGGQDHGKH